MDSLAHARMQLLADQACRVVCVFYKSGNCVLLPLQPGMDYQQFIHWAHNHGFEWIGVMALMKTSSLDGQPLVEHEFVSGVAEETVQRARDLFTEDLAADSTAAVRADSLVSEIVA